jgi:hypothetical protein
MVGCCHGHPARIGLRYGKQHAEEGFPEYLVNVRLFPVQAIEFTGLLIIAGLCAPFLLWGRAGSSLAWFLFAYAALRFATEGLRADERPSWGGMSWPRIMSLIQLVAAIWIVEQRPDPVVWAGLFAAAVLALLTWLRYDWVRHVLSRRHIKELRQAVSRHSTATDPVPATTSAGVSVVVSAWPRDEASLHVSVRLGGRDDLGVICRLVAAAFPHLDVNSSDYTDKGTIHLVLPRLSTKTGPGDRRAYRHLYETCLRRHARAEHPEASPFQSPQRSSRIERPWFWRASA